MQPAGPASMSGGLVVETAAPGGAPLPLRPSERALASATPDRISGEHSAERSLMIIQLRRATIGAILFSAISITIAAADPLEDGRVNYGDSALNN